MIQPTRAEIFRPTELKDLDCNIAFKSKRSGDSRCCSYTNLRILTASKAAQDGGACKCPDGYEDWLEDSDNCFKFPADSKPGNYWQSEAVCKYEHDGGKLVVVDTPELNDELALKLEDFGPDANCVIDLQGNMKC